MKKILRIQWIGAFVILILGFFVFWTPIRNLISSSASDKSDPVHLSEPTYLKLAGPSDAICFSPDGKMLLSLQSLRITGWNTENWKQTMDITIDENIQWMQFTLDGKRFLTKTARGIMIWDAKRWSVLDTVYIPEVQESESVQSVAAVSDSVIVIAFAAFEKDVRTTIKVYDLIHKQMVYEWKDSTTRSANFCLSPNGKLLATKEYNGSESILRIHELPTGKIIDEIEDHHAAWVPFTLYNNYIARILFTQNSKEIAWLSTSEVKLYDLEKKAALEFNISGRYGKFFEISPDAKLVCVYDLWGGQIFSVTKEDPLTNLNDYDSSLRSCVFSPDNKFIALNFDNLKYIEIRKFETAVP
jgi:WD40 repeat protein